MYHATKVFLLFFSILTGTQAFAGIFEVGLSANYRNQRVDDNNYSESLSTTGSLSYYFLESSAIELSYTRGESKQTLRDSEQDENTVVSSEHLLYGIDFVFSFSPRTAALQPYVKLGVAHVDKKYYLDLADDVKKKTGEQGGTSPSAGLGLKIKLTEQFSLKLGIDGWMPPAADNESSDHIDYATRAGISWMF